MKKGTGKTFIRKDAYARLTPSGNVAGYYRDMNLYDIDTSFATKTLERFAFDSEMELDSSFMTEEKCDEEDGRKFKYTGKFGITFGISFFQDYERLLFTIY